MRPQLKEGALQNGLPEPVAIPNDREELAQKGVILFFQLWCVAERESGLRARHHNAYRENLVGKSVAPAIRSAQPNVDGMSGLEYLGHVF